MAVRNVKSCLLLTITTSVLALTLFCPWRDYVQAANLGKRLAQADVKKTGKDSTPLSEVQFHITDALLGKARLFPDKVTETLLPDPYGCPAPQGGKEIEGRFRLEFEIDGKRVGTYFLNLTFVEDHFWAPTLKKNNVPLAGQSKEQIVIIQYETCNNISALIFGYDLNEKKIVRYLFSDSDDWRVSLSVGTRFLPDGRVQVLEVSKPDGMFQKRFYNNAVWGLFLDRYFFDQPTLKFLKIPMVVGMRVHLDTPGISTMSELVLYEDGYLTDMGGRDKFVPRIEVYKLLDSDAAEGLLKLREKSGRRLESDFGSDSLLHDYFFSIRNRDFSVRCGQTRCPKEILFIRDKLVRFWGKDPAK